MQQYHYNLIDFKKFKGSNTLREMSLKEAKEYFKWFHSIIPQRLEVLINQVKEDNINLDYSRDSLSKLYKWFIQNVFFGETKIKDLDGNDSYAISGETYCICIDISIYFSECLIRNTGGRLFWDVNKGSKNYADRHMPVVAGFTYKQDYTILPILIWRAYSVLENKENNIDDILTFQYDRWIKEIPEPGKEYILKGVDKDRQQKVLDSVFGAVWD